MSCSTPSGVPDLYYTGGLIPQAYVDYCKETGSQDIMYTTNGDMDRITGQLTELDAYYLGLTARPAEADRWQLGLSEYEGGMMLPAIPSMAANQQEAEGESFRFFRYDL